MADRAVVILDCETNGTDSRVHEAWDVGWWNLTTGQRGSTMLDVGVPEFLYAAELPALRVNRFVDRYEPLCRGDATAGLRVMLDAMWPLGSDLATRPVIVGSNPGFDLDFVGKALRDRHLTSGPDTIPWHHHPIDIGSYAAGALGIELGTGSLSAQAVADMVGVAPGDHSAMGDVESEGLAYLVLRQARRAAYEDDTHPSGWIAKHGPDYVAEWLGHLAADVPF